MIVNTFIDSQHLEKQLRQDTEALAMPNGRRIGQPGHDIACKYLKDRLKELGLRPFKGDSFELPYIGHLYPSKDEHSFTNLVGVIPGKNRKLPPILLGAHYDSVIDAPCADDNATSVALNLAIAEYVMRTPLKRDLIIALYDAEEPPYFLGEHMGSTRFHDDHCADMNFSGVIVTDLIGHDLCITDLVQVPSNYQHMLPDTHEIVFMTGSESDSTFPEIVEAISPTHPRIKVFPTLNRYTGNLSDHHAFEQAGHPFLFFSCAQGKYYHHELDTLDWINFTKLANITKFIGDLIYQLDDKPAGKSLYAKDPVDFEIRMIQQALDPTKLDIIFKALNIEPPQTRQDMDKLIEALLNGVLH